MLAAGVYDAVIANYAIRKTKAGDPAPTIAFLVQDKEGRQHKVFWQSGLNSDKGREITLKALLVCGLENPADLALMARGPESGVLNMQQPVSVTIEHEADQQDPTKIYPRVRWVNAIGEQGSGEMRNTIEEDEARMLLASLPIGATFYEIKQRMKPVSAKNTALPDIPF